MLQQPDDFSSTNKDKVFRYQRQAGSNMNPATIPQPDRLAASGNEDGTNISKRLF